MHSADLNTEAFVQKKYELSGREKKTTQLNQKLSDLWRST